MCTFHVHAQRLNPLVYTSMFHCTTAATTSPTFFWIGGAPPLFPFSLFPLPSTCFTLLVFWTAHKDVTYLTNSCRTALSFASAVVLQHTGGIADTYFWFAITLCAWANQKCNTPSNTRAQKKTPKEEKKRNQHYHFLLKRSCTGISNRIFQHFTCNQIFSPEPATAITATKTLTLPEWSRTECSLLWSFHMQYDMQMNHSCWYVWSPINFYVSFCEISSLLLLLPRSVSPSEAVLMLSASARQLYWIPIDPR